MSNANHTDRNRVKSVAALDLVSQTTCPIASTEVGLWNNNGTIKWRDADGNDSIVPVQSGLPVFGAYVKTAATLTASTGIAPSYDNGSDGVGAYLQGVSNGAIGTVGGVALSSGDVGKMILVDSEATAAHNGLYELTVLGGASAKYKLVRVPGMDAEIVDGSIVGVTAGTSAGIVYTQTEEVTTVGTDSVAFAVSSTGVTWAAIVSAAATATTTLSLKKETNQTINVATSTSSNTAGANLSIAAAAGVGSGNGGVLAAAGGAAGATGVGGGITVTGGAGGATSGAGGTAGVVGGAGTNGNAAGGASSLTGGAGQGSAAGGASALAGGVGGATGAGGAASVTGGAGGATSGTGGAVAVAGGAGTAGNANGGAVTIRGGNAHGSGTDGTLAIGDADTSAISIGATGILTVNTGYFQARGNASVTATVGGGTTGLIPAGASFVTVTSDNADKQISLPTASVGDRIRVLVGATGCELISSVASHKVNDVVVGATNEAALTATNMYDCQYLATDTWIVIGYTNLGAVQAALVPDAL